MRSLLLLVAAIQFVLSIHAQGLQIQIMDEEMDRDTRLLYEFLDVERLAIEIGLPAEKKHDVIWVARGLTPEGEERRDTLFNSFEVAKIFNGVYPGDPLKDVVLVIGRTDNNELKINGNVWQAKFPIRAEASYQLVKGISGNEPVKRNFNEAIPVMIYSLPYTDKNNATVKRYCYTNEIPADQWCKTYGVPHLVILELTVLP